MRKSLTYGTLPTREEFEEAFDAKIAQPETGWARFHFGNDPRVGTCALTRSELWRELVKAQREWETDEACCEGETCEGVLCHSDACEADPDAAGRWCSDVLGVLGFEWI